MVEFNYDQETDILVADKQREPEDYESSIPVGDYIIDINEDNEVLGIEILNASQNLPFTKEELRNIKQLKLKVEERNKAKTISLNIQYSTGNKGKISFGYPEPAKT